MININSRNSIKNLISDPSILRNIVFNLSSLDTSFFCKVPLQGKITRYVLDFSNIEKLIFNIIRNTS